MKNLINKPISKIDILDLFNSKLLTEEAKNEALNFHKESLTWWYWANRILLFLGFALLLSGIIFFFAFNWAKMGTFQKFAIIESGILACASGAWIAGLDELVGKVLLLSAALFVGVFLAVFGQIYQTGADAYELFTGWSLLITGWVIISEFAGLWLMWLILINLAINLYWQQVVLERFSRRVYDNFSFVGLFLLLALINGLAFICREYGDHINLSWLKSKWPRWILLFLVLVYLIIPTEMFIISSDFRNVYFGTAVILWIVSSASSYWFFRFKSPDLLCITICAMSFCLVILTLIGRIWFEISNDPYMLLFYGMIVVGVISGMTIKLNKIRKEISGESYE